VAAVLHTTARAPGFLAAGIAPDALRRQLVRLITQAIGAPSPARVT
jgi:hypothetical protein